MQEKKIKQKIITISEMANILIPQIDENPQDSVFFVLSQTVLRKTCI